MQRNMIKLQFEQILKDTKILCELDPFVKKWSFDEMLPHFEISNLINEDSKLGSAEILRDKRLKTLSDDGVRDESLLRKLKGIMMVPKDSDDDPSHSAPLGKCSKSNILLENQYDHELKKTLKALEEIEAVDAVTQTDIDDFVRGLGGKPDGIDLNTTNIREWKYIFLEHWLDLNHLARKNSSPYRTKRMIKQRKTLPNIIRTKSPIKKDHHEDVVHSQKIADRFSVCTSSRVKLDGHFMTRKERKNMATSFKLHVAQIESTKNGLHSTSSPYVFAEYQGEEKAVPEEKSLLTLQKEHHETSLPRMEEKTASSAMIGASLPRYKKLPINDFKASGDNFYGDRERQTKKMVQNNCMDEVKFKSEVAKKAKNAKQLHRVKDKKAKASVRPSSAIPSLRL